ncbi:uncharacterized protein LOC111625244 [Centruroides sculpturatus]|uniref:uncharacterized protein LOC111625244 n=1 Tax=Centruroides sculpturatus TaxID=218467 RepID=UPI000C6D5069|nr:uncharacterized protein LOC111625244 [Centruroides sculpturatus]
MSIHPVAPLWVWPSSCYVITVCLTITFVTCRGAPRTHQEMVLCGRKIKLSSKEEPEVTAFVSHPFLDVTLGIVPQVEYTVNVHLSSRVTSSISKVALLSEGEFRIPGDGYTICGSSNGTIITNTVKGSFSLIWIPSHVQKNSKIKLMILRSISEEEWVFHTDYYGWRNNCFQAMVPQGDLTYSDVRYLSNCSVFNIYPKSPPDSRQLVQFQDVLLSDEGYIALHLNSESFVDIIINSENLEEYLYHWIESLEGNLLIRFHSCQKCQFKIGTSFLDIKNGCIAVLNSQQGIFTNPGKSLERECSIQIITDNIDEHIYLLIPKRKSSVTDQCADNYATVSLLVSGNITLCPGREQMNLLSTGVKLIITFRTSDLKIFYKSVKMCQNMTVTEESGNICSFGNYGECYYIINTPVGYGIDLDFIYLETGRSLNCEGNYMTIQDTEKLINFCGNMTDKTNKIQSAKNLVTLRMSMLQPMEAGRGFCAVYRTVVQNDSFTACDYGWVSGSYYCYKLFTMQADWKSSNEVCKDNGGHLASIEDIHVQELVNEILLTSAYLSPKTAVWIGGNDITYENCYEWSSGQMFQYTNWFPGWKQYGGYNAQPNDDGLANQDCIELRNTFRYPSKGEGVTDTFYWNDRDCNVHNAFICQKPRPGVSILEYAKPDCNRTVRLDAARDRDMITSPLYPDNYPSNVKCFIHIIAPEGRLIDLQFNDFILEDHESCQYDYLTIEGGVEASGIHYCGDWRSRIKLLRQISTSNMLKILFFSDFSQSFRGFRAEVSLVPEKNPKSLCDNHLFRSHENYCYLVSTYPEVSWDTANRICTETQSQLATVTSTEEKKFLHSLIRSAEGYMSGVIYWIGSKKKSGEITWNWLNGERISSDIINLDENSALNQPSCLAIQWRHHNVTSDLFWSGKRCNHSGRYICKKLAFVLPDNLNTTLKNNSGRLTSVNYPAHYTSNMHYVIKIESNPASRIVINLDHLEVEWQEDCLYDYLEITERLAERGKRFCGSLIDEKSNYVSEQPVVYLVFHSDYSVTGSGFVLRWESVIGDSCGELHKTSSYIVLPSASRRYLPGLDCFFNLSSSSRILITLTHFHVGSQDGQDICSNDYLKISLDQSRTIILCGNSTSVPMGLTFLSYREVLDFHFHTNSGTTLGNTGFNITWRIWNHSKVESYARHEKITSNMGDLYSLNFPLDPPMDVDFIQNLIVPLGYRINSVYLHHDLQTRGCEGKIVIEDPYGETFNIICPSSKLYRNISSTLNILRFFSTTSFLKQPIKYHISYNITTGEINHGEYMGETGRTLELRIKEHEAAIRLKHDNSPWYIANVRRSNYVSEQPVVYLVFHSDYSVTGSGFVLRWESVIGDSCGELHKTSSYIVLPSASRRYLPGLDCFFNLSSSSRILITLTHFHVGSQDGQDICSNDYLKISLDQSRTIILCGNSTSVPMGLTFLSYREVLDFHFHTNSGTTLGNTGFNITWRIWNHSKVESYARHEKITSNMGDLYSLNFPLDPPMDVDFIQNLIVPLGYRINSVYLHHDLQTRGCEGKIVIEDPYGETFNIICPSSKLYRNISSTLNILRFFSTTSFLKQPIKYHISYNITTDPGYIHKTLKIHSVYSCMPNPCLHGGSCIESNKSQCNCTGSYTGVFCHLQWCQTRPCGERGVCQTVPDGYRCSCPPEYTGSSCEEPITPCNANPCGPHGQCSVFNDTFKCHCQLWYEGSHCERFVFRITQKPLSQRMLEEPFWLGLITVFAVLLVILCVYCIKRKFAEKIERLLAEEIEKSKCNPSPPAARYSLSSNQLSLTPGSQSPQTCPKSLFTKFRKYSIRSTTSGISPTDREHSRTFSFDDILRRSTKKTSSGPTDNNKNDDEKSRILASLVMSPQTRRMSLDEFIRMSERKIQEANREEEQKTCNSPESESIQETSFSARLSPRFARHSAPSFTEFHSIREQSVEYASSTESEEDPKTSQVQADITPPPQTTQEDKEVSDKKKAPDPSAIQKTGFLEVPTILLPTPTTPDNPEKERTSENPQSPVRKKPEFLVGRKYSVDLPMPKILVTSNTSSIESDPNSPPRTPNPAKSMAYLTPLTADRTISESNLSTSGYSSLSSPGLSRCNSSSPISDDLENQNANTKKVSPPHKWHNHPKCHQTQQIVATLTEGEQPQYKTRTFTNALWRAPNRKTCHHDRCMKRHSYQTSTDESIDDEGIGMDPIDFKIRKGEVKSARELEAYITKKTPLMNFTSSDTSTSSPTTRTSPNLRKGDKVKKTGTKGRKSPVASPTSVSASETTAEGNTNVAHSSDSDQEYQRPKTQTRRTKKDGTSSPRITEGRRSVSSEKLGSKQTRNGVARCNSSTAIPQIITENFDFIVAKDKKSSPRSSAEKILSVDDSIESSVPSDTDEEKTMEPLLPSESFQSNLRRQEALVEESDSADSSSETTVLLRKERTSIPELEEAGTQTDLTSAVVVYPGDEALLNVS